METPGPNQVTNMLAFMERSLGPFLEACNNEGVSPADFKRFVEDPKCRAAVVKAFKAPKGRYEAQMKELSTLAPAAGLQPMRDYLAEIGLGQYKTHEQIQELLLGVDLHWKSAVIVMHFGVSKYVPSPSRREIASQVSRSASSVSRVVCNMNYVLYPAHHRVERARKLA